jgi:hypothetical protein
VWGAKTRSSLQIRRFWERGLSFRTPYVAGTTLERLSSLVDHNLLQHSARGESSRYSMLETIREFASELLERSGEATAIRRRQLEFLIDLSESANLFAEAEGPQRQELMLPENENARAAIEWAIEAEAIDLGLRLAVVLENFWVTRDPYGAIGLFERLLASEGAPPTLRARALRACAGSYPSGSEIRSSPVVPVGSWSRGSIRPANREIGQPEIASANKRRRDV